MQWMFVDFFDTLVLRSSHPDVIKAVWAKKMCIYKKMDIPFKYLYDIRKASENKISQKLEGIVSVDYSYKELCEEIWNRLQYILANNGKESFQQFYEDSINIEKNLELEYLKLNKELVVKIEKAISYGLKIAIVSDFYMGSSDYQYFLKNLGISHLIDKVYVSCDYAMRKDQGLLYQFILNDLNIQPNECIMIGDNRKADYYIPKSIGIKAYLIKSRNIKNVNLNTYLYKSLWILSKKYSDILLVNYAFSLYYYIFGLYNYLRRKNIKKVTFMSREGEYLKELFDLFLTENKICDIESQYIYVSRKSTFVPTLKNIENEQFEILFRQYRDISPRSFLTSIGFNQYMINKLQNQFAIDFSEVIQYFNKSEFFEILKKNTEFIELYNIIRKEQKSLFLKYLHQFINTSDEEAVICDVGWKGTIQDNIYLLIGNKVRVSGVYIGLTDNLLYHKNNMKIGINFSNNPVITKGFNIWGYDKSLYEKLLCASHSATSSYQEKDGLVVPVFAFCKQDNELYTLVRPIQIEMKKAFENINDVFKNTCLEPEDLECTFRKIHLKMVCSVTLKELKFQDAMIMQHTQNFGEVSWSQKKVVGIIQKIFMENKRKVFRKIYQEGLSIKYMYAGIKVLQKAHLTVVIPLYTKMVYIFERFIKRE